MGSAAASAELETALTRLELRPRKRERHIELPSATTMTVTANTLGCCGEENASSTSEQTANDKENQRGHGAIVVLAALRPRVIKPDGHTSPTTMALSAHQYLNPCKVQGAS